MTTMNSNGKLSIFAAGLSVIVSCSQMTQPVPVVSGQRQEVVINAGWPASKTLLDGKQVLWSDGDSVAVVALCDMYGSLRVDYDYGVYAENINGSSADFTAVLMGDHTPAYMVYPGNESLTYDAASGTITTQTYGSYVAVQNTFPQGSNLSAGRVIDGQTAMQNLMSVFRFEITGTDIVAASIESRAGESLYGMVTIDAGTLAIASVDGYPSISLVPAEGQTHIAPGIYCIPVPAGTYSEGLAIDLVDDQGFHARKSKIDAFELPAGKLIDLGRQSDWGVEIHLGMCVTGELSVTGDGEFTLSGNLIKGKAFELENTVCGVEYSTDKGLSWTSVEYGVPDSDTFDMDFEAVSPGKMLYRAWAKYKDDDIVRGEQKAYVPGHHIVRINFQSTADVEMYLRQPETSEPLKLSVSRRTDKGYVGTDVWKGVTGWSGGDSWNNEDNVSWDSYQMQVAHGYWADWRILFPGPYEVAGSNGNSTTWYTLTGDGGNGFRFGCKTMAVSLPPVAGCMLDRVKIVYTTTSRKAQISSTYNKATPVGPTKAVVAATEITADVIKSRPDLAGNEGLFWSEFVNLSTDPGNTGLTTQENTAYYIYTSTNAWMKILELEYIPVE